MLTPDLDPAAEPTGAAETSTEERRAAVRRPSGQNASCHPAAVGAAATAALVKDVSSRGVGLLMSRRFEPGMLLVLELGAEASPFSVFTRVVRLAPATDGRWLVGCAFLEEIGDEELRAFLAEPARTADVRLPEGRMAACRRDSPGWIGRWIAEVRDFADAGVGLILPAAVELGARLRVDLLDAGGLACATLVRVVHRERQEDNRWLLGCEMC